MPACYFTRDGKTKYGPYTPAQLQAFVKSGQLLPTDMVIVDGTTRWTQASGLLWLFPLAQQPPMQQPQQPGSQKPLAWWQNVLAVVFVLIVLSVVLNVVTGGGLGKSAEYRDAHAQGLRFGQKLSQTLRAQDQYYDEALLAATLDGVRRFECPHPSGSVKGGDWMKGYEAGLRKGLGKRLR